jgi:FkbM family methyltransferase
MNRVRLFIRRVWLFIQPRTIERKYLGYKLFHYKYDTLIDEIRKSDNQIYEEFETQVIRVQLQHIANPVMLDIGANIGLMSMNACHFIPNLTSYAFEPGPHQFQYLKMNVEGNNLQRKIFPINIALGDRSGTANFYIHDVEHASGDGLIDTGRAGKATAIEVQLLTLDDWWYKNNKPAVHFIKIDTEGGEFGILKHANNFLSNCRPVMLIEICYLNYEKYGLLFEDYLGLLREHGYALYDLKKEHVIDELNFEKFIEQFYYLAVPKT